MDGTVFNARYEDATEILWCGTIANDDVHILIKLPSALVGIGKSLVRQKDRSSQPNVQFGESLCSGTFNNVKPYVVTSSCQMGTFRSAQRTTVANYTSETHM